MISIKGLKKESFSEVEEWLDELPVCPIFNYLLFIFNEIGIIADEITQEMMTKENFHSDETNQWRFNAIQKFVELIWNPPLIGKSMEWQKRAEILMHACILLGFWHRQGDEIIFMYEVGLRGFVKEKIPTISLPSLKEELEKYKVSEDIKSYTRNISKINWN